MQKDRTYLKDRFKTGDQPTGQDFIDLIDSFHNKEEEGSLGASDIISLITAPGVIDSLRGALGVKFEKTTFTTDIICNSGIFQYGSHTIANAINFKLSQIGGDYQGWFTLVSDGNSDISFTLDFDANLILRIPSTSKIPAGTEFRIYMVWNKFTNLMDVLYFGPVVDIAPAWLANTAYSKTDVFSFFNVHKSAVDVDGVGLVQNSTYEGSYKNAGTSGSSLSKSEIAFIRVV